MKERLYEIQEKIRSTKVSKRDKIYNLKEQEFHLLNNFLLKNDTEYKEIVEESMVILSNSVARLKTYKDNSSYFGTYTSHLRGNIHKNGVMYVNGIKSPFPWFGLSQHMYPKRFSGHIDWRGHIDLKVTEKGFLLFGSRVPERFILKILKSGNVSAKMDKYSFEFTGVAYIDKLICDPFNNSELERSKFLSNRLKLIKKLQNLKAKWLD